MVFIYLINLIHKQIAEFIDLFNIKNLIRLFRIILKFPLVLELKKLL